MELYTPGLSEEECNTLLGKRVEAVLLHSGTVDPEPEAQLLEDNAISYLVSECDDYPNPAILADGEVYIGVKGIQQYIDARSR